jgi:hypothetical protein
MATTAAAAAAAHAPASEQEVQLHVLASSDAVLQEFQQRFEPVSARRPAPFQRIPRWHGMRLHAAHSTSPCTCPRAPRKLTGPPLHTGRRRRPAQAEGFRCSLHYPGDAAAAPPPGFDAAAYAAALSTRQLGRLLLATPSIASTQEFMRRHAGVLPEGTVLVAERQTSGKGAVPAARTRRRVQALEPPARATGTPPLLLQRRNRHCRPRPRDAQAAAATNGPPRTAASCSPPRGA